MQFLWSIIATLIVGFICAAAFADESDVPPSEKVSPEESEDPELPDGLSPGLYAIFETSLGNIVCRLFEKQSPLTVANFVDLVEGTKEWLDPTTREKVRRPFYDGLTFHRVIPEFMIQGGCPLGDGRGGPGYQFKDEFDSDLKFNVPGLLAMANSGPNTNGSQFFITEVPTPHLNNRHTIFGEIVGDGLALVKRIARVPCNGGNKPSEPVILEHVIIRRLPSEPVPVEHVSPEE